MPTGRSATKLHMNTIGAVYTEGKGCVFTVWAPLKETMILHIIHPSEYRMQMQKDEWGYFTVVIEEAGPGTQYFFMPNGLQDLPDPASHYQPEGVHGPSEVVDHSSYQWQDIHWRGIPLKELVLYEIHVGTFTEEGTFQAIIPRLPELAATGINALELMPVSQFPGHRNWGYDGVYPYAVQNSYGGPDGLKALVDACHLQGIAVFLDVVYNHQGPEGNYLPLFGPYFTDKYCTPWGDAINYDGEYSDGVRGYFANNALHWMEHYHIDGLRCDAIHAVFDSGAVHFWELMHKKVKDLEQKLGRPLYLIAESDLNSPRVVKSPENGGYGFDAQWLDDFHHSLYVLLDKKGKNRYEDFGSLEQLAKGYSDGFVHSGEYVRFRKRKHGASSAGLSGDRFIAFTQNHDQIGNRVGGERMALLVNFEQLKLAAAALLLSPYIPMLFMGEEYAEESRFYYFVSHGDPNLVEAVRKGRKKEFENFKWETEPLDPQAETTFRASQLNWNRRWKGKHRIMLKWYKHLIHLRRTHPILRDFDKNNIRANPIGQRGLALLRQSDPGLDHLLCLFNFSAASISYDMPYLGSKWVKLLDSKEDQWKGRSGKTQKEPLSIYPGTVISLSSHSITIYQTAKRDNLD